MTVLVAGIGNLFNSDDGFGPEVARRLCALEDHRRLCALEDHRRLCALKDHRRLCALDDTVVRVVDYGIRGMHLAYDLLDGYDALVLVDAVPVGERPGTVTVLEVGPDDLGDVDLDPHGMNPVAVLASLDALGGSLPRTYVVGCRPATVEEGIGLSPAVAAAVPEALGVLTGLLDRLHAGVEA